VKKEKIKSIECEVCKESNKAVLHKHHIIPRVDVKSTDDWNNLVVLCSNCHNLTHAGFLKIIGIYPSTKLPYRRTLVYEKNGTRNIPGIDNPYIESKPNIMKFFGNNTKEE
jgi:hypothetical protein